MRSRSPDRLSPDRLGSVLGVWAHPDDEAYLMAGTALLAAAAGCPVACLTATAGEAGESWDEARWPRTELGAIRRRELAASLAELGVSDHTWLGLPDGGLASVDPGAGVGLVAEVMERVRPDTVLTFGVDGMTGHPDHVTVGDWARRAAREVLGDRCQVLAATRTREVVEAFADVNAAVYGDTSPPFSPLADIVLEVHLDGVLLDRKVRALEAQASQTGGLSAWMGADTYGRWVAEEFWVRPPLSSRD